MENPIETTADLRRVLIDTISGVKSGEVAPNVGNSIAKLANSVVQTSRLDIEHAKSTAPADSTGTRLVGSACRHEGIVGGAIGSAEFLSGAGGFVCPDCKQIVKAVARNDA